MSFLPHSPEVGGPSAAFQFHSCYVPAVWPQGSHLTSLSLRFAIHIMELS